MKALIHRLCKVLLDNTSLFVGVFVILNLIVLRIPFAELFDNQFPYERAKNIERLLNALLSLVISLWLINKFNLEKLAGLKQWKIRTPLLLLIPFIYPMSLAIPNFRGVDFSQVSWISFILFLVVYLARGLAEEFAIRGLLQPYLLKKYFYKYSVTKIVLLSSLVFALMHITNISRYSYVDIINQVIVAFFFGVLFGALMIRTGNVIVLGIIHGLINIVFKVDSLGIKENQGIEKFAESFTDIIKIVLTNSLIAFPMFVIGILLLRKINKIALMEKLEISKSS